MPIAVLIDDFYEDSEYAEPAKAFREAGYELVHLGLTKGATVKGKQGNSVAVIDEQVERAEIDDFDALLIPGGYSPDHLRGEAAPVEFVKRFMQSGKPVFAICHAPQLLITADLLRGRKVTGWKSIAQDIRNAGATFVDQEIVRDGNLISSRGPKDIPAFIRACLETLKETAVTK